MGSTRILNDFLSLLQNDFQRIHRSFAVNTFNLLRINIGSVVAPRHSLKQTKSNSLFLSHQYAQMHASYWLPGSNHYCAHGQRCVNRLRRWECLFVQVMRGYRHSGRRRDCCSWALFCYMANVYSLRRSLAVVDDLALYWSCWKINP